MGIGKSQNVAVLREGTRGLSFHYLVQGPLNNPQESPNRIQFLFA